MSLRALDTPDDLERFVALTRQIRALERERDALKKTITEALYREPTDGTGQPYVDYAGFRVDLASRPRYVYTQAVRDLEKQLREMKARERHSGAAFVESMGYHPRCTPHEPVRETEARERKATKIAAYLAAGGLTPSDVRAWEQPRRDEAARLCGQRSPSEKTWAVVLEKLTRPNGAVLAEAA